MNTNKGGQHERIKLQELRRTAAVPERGDGGKGAGHRTVKQLRADARKGLSHAADRQSDRRSEGSIHPMGGAAHGRDRVKRSLWPTRDAVRDYFPLPKEIFSLDLSAAEIAIYAYLLFCEDRQTFQCWPSYRKIGEAVGLSPNTISKHIRSLEERGLLVTEPTLVRTKDGKTRNGNLRFTICPIQAALQQDYDRQMQKLDKDAVRRKYADFIENTG